MCSDIKPENFLLTTKSDDGVLKAADFGLSTYFSPGQIFSGIVGSAFYVAPEVLRRRYSFQAGASRPLCAEPSLPCERCIAQKYACVVGNGGNI